jgi:hypothetical protein
MSWTPTKKLLKKIKVGQEREVVFHRLEADKDIERIHATCSCTNAEYNTRRKELKVVYKGKFPKNKTQPIHMSTQTITIWYTDKSYDKLYIQANVYRR